MELIFVKLPKTASTFFERNFDFKTANINGIEKNVRSVGHSWLYPTQIKGWRDWDFPNQEWGIYRDVDTFSLNPTDRIVTIIRNPFEILFSYFNYDWGWCRTYHNLLLDDYTKEDFQKFVDIYLDDSIPFHAPAYKKSLFSQLKDINGKWILKRDSIVMRFENLNEDIKLFSKLTNLPITNYSNEAKNQANKKPFNWWEAYREDQVHKLNELWYDDLEYFGYSFNQNPANITIESNITKKPKVALCFSGFIRDIDYTKDFWTSLIDKYDIDVYGSFWDDENPNYNDTIKNLKSIYNFKELEFEKYSNFKKSTLDVITPYLDATETLLPNLKEYADNFHTLSMWYKIWKANMLSKSLDIEYDVVIRGRTDTYINDGIDIEKNNYLNIPSGRVKTSTFPNSEGLCDVFAFANTHIMDYYSSTYLNLLEYVNQGHYMIPPENLLKVHMSRVSLDIRFFSNKLIITRYSKGTSNEVYDKSNGVVDEIISSDIMETKPNKNIRFTLPIRDVLKF
jgi:hypothetical protein